MYGCESWTIKKAECRRIDAFKLWCLRRLLRVPWTAWRSNQSILKEISPEYSLEGLMLKLKRQYFGHLMWRTDSLEKSLMLGNVEGGRRKGWQDEMAGWPHRLNGHEFGWTPGVGDGQGGLACCSPWGRKGSHTTEWLNWTEPPGRMAGISAGALVLWDSSKCSWGSIISHLQRHWSVDHLLRVLQHLSCRFLSCQQLKCYLHWDTKLLRYHPSYSATYQIVSFGS